MTDIKEEALDYEKIRKIPGIVGYVVKEGDTLWSNCKNLFYNGRKYQRTK